MTPDARAVATAVGCAGLGHARGPNESEPRPCPRCIAEAVTAAIAEEREACAGVAASHRAPAAAAAIRARSTPPESPVEAMPRPFR
jgi:hypothetical protein